VVNGLKGAFAHYDTDDVWSALSVSMGVFHRIATETAAHLRYDYPAEKAIKASDWVHACGSEKGAARGN
jgi:hypothetical protein